MAKTTEKELLDMLRKSSGFRIDGEVKELVELALEKQIALNPNLIGDGYFGGEPVYDEWECPRCGNSFEIDFDGELKYCPECGQRLSWER